MSFETLNARISALHETTKHASILIDRLRNLNFQPGSLPLPSAIDADDGIEEENVITELSQEIKEVLREETESFDLLKEEVAEVPGGKAGSRNALLKESLENLIESAQRELNESQTTFYAAIKTAKQSLADARKLEHEILASSLKTPEPPLLSATSTPPISPSYQSLRTKKGPLTAEEKEVAASSDVTAALRRTHDLMLSELSRSQFANETLEESTAALAELSEKYSTLDTLLAGSRNLLGSLLRSQKSDTWYLETAFGILVATICWLVFRRFIYGPAWWLVWLPLKYFYRVLAWISSVVLGISGARGVDSGVSGSGTTLQSERPSLTIHNQATRAPKVEGQAGRGRPPVINVGGGGKGGPMRSKEPGQAQSQDQKQENSIIDEVGEIIDGEDTTHKPYTEEKSEVPEQEQVTQQEEEVIIPNPKKRMFEANIEDKKEEQRRKDEL